jgi:hypothetical protein
MKKLTILLACAFALSAIKLSANNDSEFSPNEIIPAKSTIQCAARPSGLKVYSYNSESGEKRISLIAISDDSNPLASYKYLSMLLKRALAERKIEGVAISANDKTIRFDISADKYEQSKSILNAIIDLQISESEFEKARNYCFSEINQSYEFESELRALGVKNRPSVNMLELKGGMVALQDLTLSAANEYYSNLFNVNNSALIYSNIDKNATDEISKLITGSGVRYSSSAPIASLSNFKIVDSENESKLIISFCGECGDMNTYVAWKNLTKNELLKYLIMNEEMKLSAKYGALCFEISTNDRKETAAKLQNFLNNSIAKNIDESKYNEAKAIILNKIKSSNSGEYLLSSAADNFANGAPMFDKEQAISMIEKAINEINTDELNNYKNMIIGGARRSL